MSPLGRILGLDYGTRRVGVAVSDPGGLIAQPQEVVDRRDLSRRVRELVEELEVDRVVVGLPVSLSGREGPSAEEARLMADEVREATGLPVELYDERLSTAVAERAMVEAGSRRERRRERVDQVAAAVMLQGYLDRMGRGGSGKGEG